MPMQRSCVPPISVALRAEHVLDHRADLRTRPVAASRVRERTVAMDPAFQPRSSSFPSITADRHALSAETSKAVLLSSRAWLSWTDASVRLYRWMTFYLRSMLMWFL